MVEEATPAQIKYATSLGIENPENYSKQALKEMIQAKVDGKPKSKATPKGTSSGPAIEQITIMRTEKPHSYEFGKAGSRHKVYYGEVSELIAHIKELENSGYLDEAPEIISP